MAGSSFFGLDPRDGWLPFVFSFQHQPKKGSPPNKNKDTPWQRVEPVPLTAQGRHPPEPQHAAVFAWMRGAMSPSGFSLGVGTTGVPQVP